MCLASILTTTTAGQHLSHFSGETWYLNDEAIPTTGKDLLIYLLFSTVVYTSKDMPV